MQANTAYCKITTICYTLGGGGGGGGTVGQIADFVFWPFISFILAFAALECIKRYWETICEESR